MEKFKVIVACIKTGIHIDYDTGEYLKYKKGEEAPSSGMYFSNLVDVEKFIELSKLNMVEYWIHQEGKFLKRIEVFNKEIPLNEPKDTSWYSNLKAWFRCSKVQ